MNRRFRSLSESAGLSSPPQQGEAGGGVVLRPGPRPVSIQPDPVLSTAVMQPVWASYATLATRIQRSWVSMVPGTTRPVLASGGRVMNRLAMRWTATGDGKGGVMERRMTSVEIQAYSVEAAVRLALEQLDLTEDQVDIEILSDSGPDDDAEALVRVTAKGMAPQPEAYSGRERRGSRGRRSAPDRPSARPAADSAPEPELHSETGEMYRQLQERAVPSPRADPESEQVAVDVARDLLRELGVDADVQAVENLSLVPLDDDDPRTIFLDVIGNDLGLLIGRRGENLSQLQYLVTLLVNRRLPGFNRVILDIEGYRLRREEALIGLAERVSQQVARTHRPVALDPMPSNERRVIHMALRSSQQVFTESSGEGTMRRVMVQPRG